MECSTENSFRCAKFSHPRSVPGYAKFCSNLSTTQNDVRIIDTPTTSLFTVPTKKKQYVQNDGLMSFVFRLTGPHAWKNWIVLACKVKMAWKVGRNGQDYRDEYGGSEEVS